MPGLLDFLNSDEARLGIGLMGAAGPQTDPTKTGFGAILQNAQATQDAWKKQQMQTALAQAQIMDTMGQAQTRNATAAQSARQAQFLANPWNPDGTFNVQGAIQNQVDPTKIESYAKLKDAGTPEVASTREIQVNGQPMNQSYDKFNRPIGDPTPVWKAPISMNLGGTETLVSPTSGTVQNSFGKTVSPDAQLQSDTSRANNNDNNATQRWEAQSKAAAAALAGGKMTEDQARTASLLTEAERALTNMRAVAVDKNGKLTSAVNPGLGDTVKGLTWLPGSQQLGNLITGNDREAFNINMKRLSDVLLRAATGAGMNKDEAKEAVEKYVPQFGESATNKAQKINDLPVFLEGLRTRAGIAGAQAATAAQDAPPIVSAKAPPAIARLPGEQAAAGGQMQKTFEYNGQQVKAQRGNDGLYYIPNPDPNGKKWIAVGK